MLELALSTRFDAASNVKGTVAGANWTYLLPSLELRHALCIGAPTQAELRTLLRLADRVTVLGRRSAVHPNVRTVVCGRGKPLPLDDRSIDLAVLVGSGGAARLARDASLRAELGRVLTIDGLIYVESARWIDRLRGHRALASLARSYDCVQRNWLTPHSGEARTAVPASDEPARRYFVEHRVACPSSKLKIVRQAEQFVLRRPSLARRTERHSAILSPVPRADAGQLPEYLQSIAAADGVDLTGFRWGLSAKGMYDSRKVLFYLFPPRADRPSYVAKLTRHAALNARLENEQRALAALAATGLGRSGWLPQPAFFGHHGGLAVLGQTCIEARPFEQRTTGAADCPVARDAIELLTELGKTTAKEATGDEAASAFHALVARLGEIYALDPAHRRFLAEQADATAEIAGLPAVFQHGDPGVWNILVRSDGRAVLLDWEAADERGAPLWDLFYFLRSFTVRVGRRSGTSDSLRALARHWLGETALGDAPLGELAAAAGSRYCREVGVAEPLVRPLFYLCWVHRALKEATRLRPERLARGHYITLLRMLIDGRDRPALARILAGVLSTGSARHLPVGSARSGP